MMRVFVLVLTLAIWVPLSAGTPITLGESFQLAAPTLKEDRVLLLSLPRGYGVSQERYPVLYLLDGDANFTHTRGTLDFLAQCGLMPPMILVGIPNTQRTRDLTPTHGRFVRADGTKGLVEGSGGGEAFLDFLEQTLIPHIEANYRTQPFRILAGHSLGGLLVIHTLSTRPNLFQGLIAASPSLAWDEDQPLRRFESFLRTKPTAKVTLFVSMADEEAGAERPNRFDRLQGMLRGLKRDSSLRWEARHFPEEDHGSVVLRTHYWGLRKVFEGWRLPVEAPTRRFMGGVKDLDSHYAALSQRLGYPVTPPEILVNNLGYQALARNHASAAIAFFRHNVALYPASPNVHDSLGEALEADGKKAEAAACYAQAVALAQQAKDPRLTVYLRNRDRVPTVSASPTAPSR